MRITKGLTAEQDSPSPKDVRRTDAQLVLTVLGGDKRAFVAIVARYQSMVSRVTLAILRDFAASEDASQEAFLHAWQNLRELREPERLKGWISQIARRTALGRY